MPPPPAGPVTVVVHDRLVPPATAIHSGVLVQSRIGFFDTTAFDDFVPAMDARIQRVTWQGYYCNRSFTGNAIPEPVASAFRVRIAPDDADGQRPPFETLYTDVPTATTYLATVSSAMVSQQFEFTRQDAACGIRNGGDPAAYYRFSAALPSPYDVTAGVRYWIGVQAVMPDVPVGWYWRVGLQDNSFSIYWLGVLTTFFVDRAIAVEGIALR